MPSNTLIFPLEGLEGALSAIGEEINELSGVRLTRLQGAAAAGDTAVNVETVFGWPTAGTIYVRGRRYTYASVTIAPDAFTGLQEIRDGSPTTIPGLAESLSDLTVVADGSETFSGIENAKRMLFVSTSEGEFLDAIGRNYGRERPNGFTDAQYRELLKVLSFLPAGTIYAIEQLLDQLVGPGLYTVFEDLVNFPNCVFISLANVLATTAQGSAYFNQKEEVASTTSTTLAITQAPIQASRDNIQGVFLAQDQHAATMDVLPSAEPIGPWVYGGTNFEGASVLPTGETLRFLSLIGGNTGPNYTRTLFAEEETAIHASWTIQNPLNVASDDLINLRFYDGARSFAVGWTTTDVFLYDPVASARVGASALNMGAVEAAYSLEKDFVNDTVKLWQDGILIAEEPYSSFSATALRQVQFGGFTTAVTADHEWGDLRVTAVDTAHNYWNAAIRADGDSNLGNPARLSSLSSAFVAATDMGRRVVVSGSAAAHGRGNGAYETLVVDGAGSFVDVRGVPHTAAAGAEPLDATGVDAVRIPTNWDEFSAFDAGLQATLATGAGNTAILWTAKYGGIDGDQIAIRIIQAAPAAIQIAIVAVDDIEITIDPSIHTAAQVASAVNGQADSAALVSASSTGTAAPAAFAATNLAGGEDGKTLVLSGSLSGNNGTYQIANRVDARNALVGSHLSPAGLTTETGIDWRKDPNFPTDTNFDWELSAAGLLAGLNLTTRRPMPAANTPAVVLYTTQLSAQILLNEFTPNAPAGTYYPLYLADPFAFVRAFVDDVTVAGVLAKFKE